jgi:hypothetical protein
MCPGLRFEIAGPPELATTRFRSEQMLHPLHRRLSAGMTGLKNFPDPAPVHLAFTLALEFAAAASHSSPTLRADPVKNAGNHFCILFVSAQSDKCHISPHPYEDQERKCQMHFKFQIAASGFA